MARVSSERRSCAHPWEQPTSVSGSQRPIKVRCNRGCFLTGSSYEADSCTYVNPTALVMLLDLCHTHPLPTHIHHHLVTSNGNPGCSESGLRLDAAGELAAHVFAAADVVAFGHGGQPVEGGFGYADADVDHLLVRFGEVQAIVDAPGQDVRFGLTTQPSPRRAPPAPHSCRTGQAGPCPCHSCSSLSP